jgi:hypothetical protein
VLITYIPKLTHNRDGAIDVMCGMIIEVDLIMESAAVEAVDVGVGTASMIPLLVQRSTSAA